MRIPRGKAIQEWKAKSWSKHGKIEIVPPRLHYPAKAGYCGEDSFVVQTWTAGTKVVLLNFNMRVTVQPPS